MVSTVMLKCGCASVSVLTMKDGVAIDPPIPYCGVHECSEQIPVPDLTGRQAICSSCKQEKASSYYLPMFQYRPKRDNDLYYCGCRGWD